MYKIMMGNMFDCYLCKSSVTLEITKGGINMNLGEQIKKYRTAFFLSQEELAEKVFLPVNLFLTRKTIKLIQILKAC